MQKALIQKQKLCIFVSANRKTDSYEESANVREEQQKVHDQIQADVKRVHDQHLEQRLRLRFGQCN